MFLVVYKATNLSTIEFLNPDCCLILGFFKFSLKYPINMQENRVFVDEMKYTHLSVNPSVYYGLLYLLAALVFQTVLHWKGLALGMVCLGALPLAVMGVYLLVVLIASVFGGPIRWN